MARIFGFPDPVDEVSARLVAGGVFTMATTTVLLDQPWLLGPLTYGFAARVATGPTLSPLGRVATQVVRPRLPVAPKHVPSPPKRLAQGVGLAVTGTAVALRLSGRRRTSNAVLAGLVVASGLEAFAGICLACKAFPYLMKAGIVPADVCARCVGSVDEEPVAA
ncbi:uncharacterized protein DUF4395 [Motilibacter rhizosphaerae]|uniref:Uncharacterized protein DUF4395 n=1 Tax=Motilibacter rhizosphaerae TaxID=598652 RepID=A0A4Q7NB10_9ACTN|nr:DUF4395 domain-containing protein [Motilibacter rhizosphaerae]RZS80106.1 uncharacterized protein DUF4395 [Motilibacter rhizosphaerae]